MRKKIRELEKKANWVRKQILEAIVSAKKGHIGGALSCTDILATLYYGGILHYDPDNPQWEDRDRFILSKGHSGIALFAILADMGFFDISEMETFCQNGSRLGGHPDRRIPGIEADTGSLGHGLGIAAGLAFGAKLDNKDFLTIALLGDGECHEGSVWEGFLFAAQHKLDNLIAIIDYNKQCVLDYTENCGRLEPFKSKLSAFGCEVIEIDGHSFEELLDAFSGLRERANEKPLAIIANTIKGKGISFMEGQVKWHHGVPDSKELEKARADLSVVE